jgi:CRP-like cAMP-binding protein
LATNDYTLDATGLLENYPPLNSISDKCECKRHEILFREGFDGRYVYLLLDGMMMSYISSPEGHLRILEFFKPRIFIGSIILYDNSPYSITVEAVEPSQYLKIDKHKLEDLIPDDPLILVHLFKDLATKLRHTASLIINEYLSSEQRIVKSILALIKSHGYRTESGIEIGISLTQEDLAKFSGTSRISVSRFISQLTEEGIIRIKPKPWTILEMDQLMRFLK